MIRYLVSFLPWIAYAVLARNDDWRNGALAGLLVAVILVVIDRRSGKKWDEMVIEVSAAVFFTGITLLSFLSPHSSLMPYGAALVDAWLALTAFGSLAVRRPFTLGMARRAAPESVWKTPLFFKINVAITTAWALSFAVAAVALTVLIHQDPKALVAAIVIKTVTFVVPVVFTIRYPEIAQARFFRAEAAAEQAAAQRAAA
ncbi:hypothetical protein [Streptomyces sp. ISL-11]|uniref:hypothetical protein n=1 Tax=Streptomyces sp. ISL-11 TaxID=2819174 RepID=UPI001BE9BF70|nr:hypothetical protein [Streptomyces sp. ISL-11]MBT2383083.1 hypothetical protein [Streptomyces sp. ISL-11]